MNERINASLLELIYNSVSNNKPVDENYIDKIIEIIVNEYSLNDYVKNRKIVNKPWDGRKKIRAAEYGLFSKIITINLQTFIEVLKYKSRKLGLDSLQAALFITKEITGSIEHELEHAHQAKKYDYGADNLENLIIRGSFNHISPFRNDSYYDELISLGYSEKEIHDMLSGIKNKISTLYEFNPMERLAEYYSQKSIAEILKELNMSNVLSYHTCLELCQNYLRGYKTQSIPTKYYLSEVHASEYWSKITKLASNSDLETRLSLGLDITEPEKNYLENTIKDLELA